MGYNEATKKSEKGRTEKKTEAKNGVRELALRTKLETPFVVGVSRGNTSRGNKTRNSERKMAL